MKTTLPAFDSFTRAYLICALWSSNDESTPQGGEPFDSNYSVDDFAPEALKQAAKDCAKFQAENDADIVAAELTSERAGHCFWLNRNGHGSGFWDEYDHNAPDAIIAACPRLGVASDKFGNCDPYLGDDGQIYFT